MIIENIRLRNFRNYTDCEVNLSQGINVFIGDNAQGKTNLLESISFISATRSFRTNTDQDMIKCGEEFAQVVVAVRDGENQLKLSGLIMNEGKQLSIQRQSVKRTSDFVGILNAIVFAPDDLELFDGAPRIRRRLCDLEIGKVNKEYMRKLNLYQKTLKERNNFLKAPIDDDAYLEVLTDTLIDLQVFLIDERQKFINKMNEYISSLYQLLSNTDGAVRIEYLAPVEILPNTEAALKDKYRRNMDRDKIQKQTQIGIHKDDLEFYLDGHAVTAYASQGQRRMIVLAIKTALIRYVYEKKGTYPVLLLDDVLSELDSERKRLLFTLVPRTVQTVITTTDIDEVKEYLPLRSRIFRISNGMIIDTQEMTR
ncbi:MAG: DNA replication/repair protein RecF [Erysipelotrichaceae bacterium]|nr:DNA replication/repair protein RecF [Erysipelotrichaceae bacterium]